MPVVDLATGGKAIGTIRTDPLEWTPRLRGLVELECDTPRFLNEEQPCGDIPGPQPVVHHVVEHSTRRLRQLEAGTTKGPSVAESPIEALVEREHPKKIGWPSGHPSLALRLVLDVKRSFLIERTAASVGMQHATQRVEDIGDPDSPDHWFSLLQHSDENPEQRETVQEIGRTVERVDNPHDVSRALVRRITLLGNDTVGWKPFDDLGIQERVRSVVSVGHRVAVVGRFVINLQRTLEVRQQDGSGAPCYLDRGGFDLYEFCFAKQY